MNEEEEYHEPYGWEDGGWDEKDLDIVVLPTRGKKTENASTILIFDEKLKNLIYSMKTTIDVDSLVDRNYVNGTKTQSKIRNYLIENYLNLNQTEEPKKKITHEPRFSNERFFWNLCAISDLSICNSFDDVLKQNKQEKALYLDTIVKPRNYEEKLYILDIDNCKCACEKNITEIEKLFILRNTTTGLHLLLGCECIKKHNLLSPEDIIKLKEIIKESKDKKINETSEDKLTTKTDKKRKQVLENKRRKEEEKKRKEEEEENKRLQKEEEQKRKQQEEDNKRVKKEEEQKRKNKKKRISVLKRKKIIENSKNSQKYLKKNVKKKRKNSKKGKKKI